MPKKSKKEQLYLTDEQREVLVKIARSRTAQKREIERAQILLKYHAGETITAINRSLNVSRETIYKHIDKALSIGVEEALKDKYHCPKKSAITDDAIAYVVNLACSKPKEHGYAAEVWSLSLLAKHIKEHVKETGFDCFKKASKVTVHRILEKEPIKPHKMKYYLERRDPEFIRKMEEVLLVYQDVNLINEKKKESNIITLSYDEKPGVQVIKNTAPDLPPQPGKYSTFSRDHEYKRLGTVSILAAMNLHTGHIICQVRETHKSSDFISLLKEIDEYYSPEKTIRIILDNHSSHISKETMTYLSTRPNRFIYTHTPKHGSWLNMIESLFSKMARTFLRYIRVETKKELKERILKWVNEVNESPVVYRWKNFDFLNNMSME